MLYFFVILITLLLTTGITIIKALITKTISFTYAIFAPFFVNAYVLVLLGIITLFLRTLPFKIFDFRHKIFTIKKKEIRIYEKIKIKSWKEKVPEMGKTGGFSKRNLQSTNPIYLKKFLNETCLAEVLHALSGVLGFTCLFFFPVKDYYFVIPILTINLILHIMPCLIQRYNRYRLNILYKYKCKDSNEINN